jgi:DNA replication protein DnaC
MVVADGEGAFVLQISPRTHFRIRITKIDKYHLLILDDLAYARFSGSQPLAAFS